MFERRVIDGWRPKELPGRLQSTNQVFRCAQHDKAKGCVSSGSSPDPYINRIQYIGEMPQPGIAINDRGRLFLSGNALCGH
jgi:hypothetical protein